MTVKQAGSGLHGVQLQSSQLCRSGPLTPQCFGMI
ncbi:hypothetical protein FOQG_10445 [Fusarium oxysporum f. sp. raphani 54005]|uniref:Uncharacterized protein n=5 Tax=Fusarium oxysporum TaxID=5507 RepID=W9HNJ3_FUSOX|nr:hypothetical protein FOYG_15995 [Fusarium oxysporum NRRL 32931]EXA34464.1 hypothetical protein FOVG_14443 [Fusarium oxysporum f. sp. pisi HDV247]EXK24436.1 hypothetical protein FOMG_18839 [Fusarium oxysporum f. sp. melonis 26406]EXK85653.1 hypothetical protein FOQG_10445 [Fusarium oxysporum f. sp. raphani 54005]EXL70090.1 hypothetical protein FOPG_14040 [Fusarium oxysporum f. sp. conglutinans race 2 54008]